MFYRTFGSVQILSVTLLLQLGSNEIVSVFVVADYLGVICGEMGQLPPSKMGDT